MSNPAALGVLQFVDATQSGCEGILTASRVTQVPALNVIGNLCRLTRCPNPAKRMIQCGDHCHPKGTTATQARTCRHIRLRDKQYGLILRNQPSNEGLEKIQPALG